MSTTEWHWKIGEAVERIRSRYHHIGRKTAAPFLAVVYPPDAEVAVLREWQAQSESLRPDFNLLRVDVLEATSRVLADIGADNIVQAIEHPMPGAFPQDELGEQFVGVLADAILNPGPTPNSSRRIVSVERLAALYPACGPRDLMQSLWDRAHSALDVPVILLVPGHIREVRTYSFLGLKDEFMYRGDLL